MKQVIIMICAIAIILVGGIGEIKYLEKTSTYLIYDMEYIQNAIENENYNLAKEQMEKTNKKWEETKNVWGIFVLHDEIDDIEESMVELKSYIEFENKEESIIAVNKIRDGLEHSVHMQNLILDNII